MTTRITPHSEEAENGFLSSILQDPLTVFTLCSDKIRGEHFYLPALRDIYQVLFVMFEERKPIDLLTVTQELRDREILEKVGGPAALTMILNFAPTAANAEYYIEIMRRKFIRREMIRIGNELIRQAFEENNDELMMLDDAQAVVTGLSLENVAKPTLQHIAEGVYDTVTAFERAYKHRGDETITGLASGIYDIDRMTGGFKKQQLILIAARTNQGKSAFAMNIAQHLVGGSQDVKPLPVAYYSMEMSYDELAARYTCAGSGISLKRLRDGFLDKDTIKQLPNRTGPLAHAPLYIDDTPQLSISDFRGRARRAVQQYRIGCFVIDYLQLMRSLTKRAKENKVIEIGEITAGLKAIAKELNVPVIACAQLNRDAEKRPLGFPKLSDLRESGSMENDADTVILLWRPEKACDTDTQRLNVAKKLRLEGADEAETLRNLETYTEAILAKQRNGPTGRVRLRFVGELTQFQNMTEKHFSNREDERQEPLPAVP